MATLWIAGCLLILAVAFGALSTTALDPTSWFSGHSPTKGAHNPLDKNVAYDRYETRQDAQHGAYLCRQAGGTVRWYDARTNRCDNLPLP